MAARLAEFLSAAAARGFSRGQHDCMLFAADWVLALTGHDPAGPFRGLYGTGAEAERITATAGGAKAMVADALGAGWREIKAGFQAGDIVLVDPPRHHESVAAVAVCARKVALVSQQGLVIWPASDMRVLAVWRQVDG